MDIRESNRGRSHARAGNFPVLRSPAAEFHKVPPSAQRKDIPTLRFPNPDGEFFGEIQRGISYAIRARPAGKSRAGEMSGPHFDARSLDVERKGSRLAAQECSAWPWWAHLFSFSVFPLPRATRKTTESSASCYGARRSP